MRNHSKTLLGLALVSSALLVGCGGGGSSTPSDKAGKSVGISGGAEFIPSTAASAITSQPFSQNLTVGGAPAVAPPGVSFPQGATVALITTTNPILDLSGTADITASGLATGLTLVDGHLSDHVALPPTSTPYEFVVNAPAGGLQLVDPSSRGLKSRALTFLTINGSLTLGVLVQNDGTAGIPTSIAGTVPANGSKNVQISVTATYPVSYATDYRATLSIGYTANGAAQTISQTRIVGTDGKVTFTASGATPIPAAGIDTIKLILSHV